MDIGNVSSLYLDESRFSVSSLGIGGRAGDSLRPASSSGPGGLSSFAELLDKARSQDAPPAGAARDTPLPGTPARIPAPENPSSPVTSSLLSASNIISKNKTVVDKTDKLYEQCEALETFLVKTLITGMRNTVQKSGLVDDSFAGKMYEDMLYDEYAKEFAKNAGFGLAELAYLELTGQRGKLLAR
ncbi:MAG: rod-binding protein [Treponema sp.]|jgi:flagellar protein FlgJ|nr:rod-binding protein [Treponema sp.]